VYGPDDLLPHNPRFGNNHVISGVMMDLRQLAENASHSSLVEELNVSVITKNCKYFYYCCDGTDDRVSICIDGLERERGVFAYVLCEVLCLYNNSSVLDKKVSP